MSAIALLKKIYKKLFKTKNTIDKKSIIEMITSSVNNKKYEPLKDITSVYDYQYDENILFAAEIFNCICKKFDINFIHENIFGYKTIINTDNSTKFMLEFNFPIDSYPEIIFFKKININFDIIFDVGANKGVTCCYFSKISRVVYAFEPSEKAIAYLNKHLELNLINNVEVINKAVSNTNSVQTYYDFGGAGGHNSLLFNSEENLKETIQVGTTTLDSFCAKKNIKKIDLLSIDVEGFETEVLQGAENLLKESSIEIILFEVVKKLLSEEKINILFKLLNNYGYNVYDLKLKPITVLDLKYHQDLVAMRQETYFEYENKFNLP